MSNAQLKIIEEAIQLTPQERADIADALLKSLDKPDSEIDKVWAKEAERRIDTLETTTTLSSEEVFSKYGL